MVRRTMTLLELAVEIERSVSWTQKNWRTIDGLPQPFIGRLKHQSPLWRRREIEAFLDGDYVVPKEQPVSQTPAAAQAAPEPKDEGADFTDRMTRLLRASGMH